MRTAKKLAALTLAAVAIFAPQAAMATPRVPVAYLHLDGDGPLLSITEVEKLEALTPGADLIIYNISTDPSIPPAAAVFATGCDSSTPRWQQNECTNDFINQSEEVQAFKRGDYL